MAENITEFKDAEMPYDRIGELIQRLQRAGANVPSCFGSLASEPMIDQQVVEARAELDKKIEWAFSMAATVKKLSQKSPLKELHEASSAIEGHLQKAIAVLDGNENLDQGISLNMKTDDLIEPLVMLTAMLDAVRSIRQANTLEPAFDKESLRYTHQERLFNTLAQVYEEALLLGEGGAAASIKKTFDKHTGPFVEFVRFCLEKYGDSYAPEMTDVALTKALKRSVLKSKVPE